MQQFKTIIGIFTTLLFSILTVTAQDFDPKQGYEIHTVSGLALDNQESLIQTRMYSFQNEKKTRNHKYGTSSLLNVKVTI